jgi:medium-chain acyl-[acyl-carrier-protein] hydrolase
MPVDIDLLPLSLPGHDGRLNEQLSMDLVILAGELSDELSRQALDRPFVLLGHSMGGLLVFEIARALRERGHAMPRLLVITGCRPPHTIAVKRQLSALPDQELIDVLQQRYGGIPPAVRDSPELQALLLPVLRADFRMIETYQYVEGPPLDVPLLILGGTDDPAVSASDLSDWRGYTTQQCNVRLLPGAHFFLFGNDGSQTASPSSRAAEPTPALRVILERLKQLASDASAKEDS